MKHYAGLDLSMETTQVCIVDETGRKIVSMKVESAPAMIAHALREAGGVERAVIETGRMSPAICHGLRALGIPVVCIDARQLCKLQILGLWNDFEGHGVGARIESRKHSEM